MFLVANGFLDKARDSLQGKFGPTVAGCLGAVLLIYGIFKIAQGIMSQQQRGSHLTWGGVAFVVGAFFLGTGVIGFVKTQGSGTASDLGLQG